MECCRVIDACRWMRLGIFGPSCIGASAWSNQVTTRMRHLYLHYEFYRRWGGLAVRVSYRIPEIGSGKAAADVRV